MCSQPSILYSLHLKKHNKFDRTKLECINSTHSIDLINYCNSRFFNDVSSTKTFYCSKMSLCGGSGSVCACGSVYIGFCTILCLLAQSLFLIIQTWPAVTVGTEVWSSSRLKSNFFVKKKLYIYNNYLFLIFIWLLSLKIYLNNHLTKLPTL